MRYQHVLLGMTAAACLAIAPAYADTKPPTAGSHPTGKPTTTTTPSKPSSGSNTVSNTTKPNPIAAKIMSKPQLNSKISGMLPIDPATNKTMTLDKASMGFKNQGQFIAALHVSQNLGVSFIDLKNQMVTTQKSATTGQTTMQQTGSLGSAIQAVKKTSTSTATTEASKAETQASADVSTTSSTQTTKKKSPKKHTTGGGA